MKTKFSSDKAFDFINYIFMLFLAIIILYPLYFVLVASITDPDIVNTGEVLLYPKELFLDGYEKIFEYEPLWTGYLNSIIYMVIGTAINIALTVSSAYALSRSDLPARGFFILVFFFTMLFNGGIIPTYLLVDDLGIMDTILAMVLPNAISVWNVIIAKNFFQSNIPHELLEAARIDGCNDFKFFFGIVLPTSGVIVAVLTLFYAVGHWNSYFQALMYLTTEDKYPLQIVLRNLLIINTASSSMITDPLSLAAKVKLAEQLKYGIIVVSSLPLLILYPFLQRYFVKGVMVGSIKG